MEHEGRDDEELVDEAVEDMRSDVEEMQERSEKLSDHIAETEGDGEEPADGDNGDD
jgi:hypothetical protein